MRVYLRDGSAQTILRAATLRQKLQIKLSTSPSHSILTPGRPVPALTLQCQAPGRVATGVPIFKSLIWLDPEKFQHKRDSNPGSSAPKADVLTTRPTRRSSLEENCIASRRAQARGWQEDNTYRWAYLWLAPAWLRQLWFCSSCVRAYDCTVEAARGLRGSWRLTGKEDSSPDPLALGSSISGAVNQWIKEPGWTHMHA